VSRSLSSVGITKARYSRLRKWLGLDPRCGCAKREEAINRFGRWLGRPLVAWQRRRQRTVARLPSGQAKDRRRAARAASYAAMGGEAKTELGGERVAGGSVSVRRQTL
jgi:hypothetical protein